MKTKSKTGFSLIEILVVLAIAAVIIAVVFSQANKANVASKVTQMRNDISTLASGTRQIYAHDPSGYTDVSATNLILNKVIPSDLAVKNSTTVIDQFGGTMAFTSVTPAGGVAGTFFSITYPAVPAEACMKMLGSIGSSDFAEITVGGTVFWSDGAVSTAAPTTGLYPATTAIVTACGTTPVAMIFATN